MSPVSFFQNDLRQSNYKNSNFHVYPMVVMTAKGLSKIRPLPPAIVVIELYRDPYLVATKKENHIPMTKWLDLPWCNGMLDLQLRQVKKPVPPERNQLYVNLTFGEY